MVLDKVFLIWDNARMDNLTNISVDVSAGFLRDEALARYSTFQVGGPADLFFEAQSAADLEAALEWAAQGGDDHGEPIPIFVFGGGSNLLFDDAGFRGLVVRLAMDEVKVEIADDNSGRILAGAGARMSDLVNAAAEAGVTGIEAWHGLPGTVGGAVYGNAGCFGVEVKDALESAEVFIPGKGAEAGQIVKFSVDDFEYEYRNSKLKKGGESSDGIVLSAIFRLGKASPADVKARMMEVARLRIGKQPPGASTGSFFKNPANDPAGNPAAVIDGELRSAGWLIEQCGLKGKRVGGAEISQGHANFMLNRGGAGPKGASSADILELTGMAAAAVKEKFGVELEREVVYVPAE
jgi:UDP-N-acetylmuramate dehydrogenase